MAKDTIPGQVTFPGDASGSFVTDKSGVTYPSEMARGAGDYLAGQGSMGFERNQGSKRDGWLAPSEEGGTMGQDHNRKLKSGGSHNI